MSSRSPFPSYLCKGKTDKNEEPPAILPGDKGSKCSDKKWKAPRWEGRYTVIRAAPTAVYVKGSLTCYHVYHCRKTPEELDNEESLTAEEHRKAEGDPKETQIQKKKTIQHHQQ